MKELLEEEMSYEDDLSVYDKETIEKLRENDEIDDFEEAFLRGYDEAYA